MLADICRIAYRQGARAADQKKCLGNNAEYPLVLGYGAFAVRELLEQLEPQLLLGRARSLGVAVGFDSGDFVLLGKLTTGGLKPIGPKTRRPKISMKRVLEGLQSSDGKRAFRTVYEVRQLGERAREAIPELLRVVQSDEFGIRQAAVKMLTEVAPDDPRAKAAAFQALNDSHPSVRRDALHALIAVKGLTATDLARIKEMENDKDEDVAWWSEIALRNIRNREEERQRNDAADGGD